MALVPTNENNGLTVGVGLLPLKTTNRLQMLAWGPTREPGSAYDFSGARMRLSRFWRVRGRHLHAGDAAL